MAKKKPTTATSGARKRFIAVDDVVKGVRTLTQQSAALEALVQVMKSTGLKQIEIDGFGLLERGVDEIDRFIDNVDKGVKQARRDKERAAM